MDRTRPLCRSTSFRRSTSFESVFGGSIPVRPCLTRIFLESARECNQIGYACCEQHHGQRQCEWRKMGWCGPADGIEQQIGSGKELKKKQEPNVEWDGLLRRRPTPPRCIGDKQEDGNGHDGAGRTPRRRL